MLVHVGRATTNGFQVLEVWESKEHYDRANTDILFPLMRELAHSSEAIGVTSWIAAHPNGLVRCLF